MTAVVALCCFVGSFCLHSRPRRLAPSSFGPSLETPFGSCVPPTLLWPLLTSRSLSTPGSHRNGGPEPESAQALGAIGEPAVIEALVLALTDEERAVRQAAELALGRIDVNWVYSEAAQRAIPQLEASQNDQRGWVRSAAAQVLARLHVPSAGLQAAG